MMKKDKTTSIIAGAIALAGAGIGLYYLLKKKIKVSITANPVTGNAPLEVSFTAAAEKGTEPYSYVWDFGDGNTSNLQNPSNNYLTKGSYTAKVNVTDAEEKTGSKSIVIIVTELQQGKGGIIGIVTDSSTGSPIAGVSVSFNGYSGTTDSAGNYSIQNITPGTYPATYSKTGYNSQTISVIILADVSAERNIALTSISTPKGDLAIVYCSEEDYSTARLIWDELYDVWDEVALYDAKEFPDLLSKFGDYNMVAIVGGPQSWEGCSQNIYELVGFVTPTPEKNRCLRYGGYAGAAVYGVAGWSADDTLWLANLFQTLAKQGNLPTATICY